MTVFHVTFFLYLTFIEYVVCIFFSFLKHIQRFVRNDKYLIFAFRCFKLHLENQPKKKKDINGRALSVRLITSLLTLKTANWSLFPQLCCHCCSWMDNWRNCSCTGMCNISNWKSFHCKGGNESAVLHLILAFILFFKNKVTFSPAQRDTSSRTNQY